MTHPVAPQARIGHVHLKVADLDRAIAFYSGVLGFSVTQRYGAGAAFLAAGNITTTSASTPGKALAAHPHPKGTQGSTTPRFCIRAAQRSVML